MAAAVSAARQAQSFVVAPGGRASLPTVRGTSSMSVVTSRSSLVEKQPATEGLGPAVLAMRSEPRLEARALMARPRPQAIADGFQAQGASTNIPTAGAFQAQGTPMQDFRESTGLAEAAAPMSQTEATQVALTARCPLSPTMPESLARRPSPGASPANSAGGRSPAMGLSMSRRNLSADRPAQHQLSQPQLQQQQHHQQPAHAQVCWAPQDSPDIRRRSLGERRPSLGQRAASEATRDTAAYVSIGSSRQSTETRGTDGVALKTPRLNSPVLSSRGCGSGAGEVNQMPARDPAAQRRSLGLPPWRRASPRVEAQTSASASPQHSAPAAGLMLPATSQSALSTACSQSAISAAASPVAHSPVAESQERGWQAGLRQVRHELLVQRAAHAEALAEEVRSRRREMEAQHSQQARAASEQVANLRFETALSMRQEREARMGEAAELRAMLEMLKVKIAECQAVLAARPPPHWPGEEAMHPLHAGRPPGSQGGGQYGAMEAVPSQAMEGLARELEAERLSRCSKDADIHARIGREVSDLGRRLEEQYRALGEEIADASRQMEERRMALEKVLEQERHQRAHESHELRAIIDSVWQRASVATGPKEKDKEDKTYYFRFEDAPGEEYFKEVVGDQEDINTLYEMVREALGDTVSLRQEIEEERDGRRKETTSARQQLERLERQLNTVQSLVQQATPLSSSRELAASTDSLHGDGRTPAASAPTSPNVELRRARKESSVEIIRNEFATRLEEYSRRLEEHLEAQLSTSQNVQKAHRTEMLGHVEAHMAEIFKDVSIRVERSEASLRREVRSCVEEIREQLSNVKLRSPSHRGTPGAPREGFSQEFQSGAGEQSPALPARLASLRAKPDKPGGDPVAPGSSSGLSEIHNLTCEGSARPTEAVRDSFSAGDDRWSLPGPRG